MRNQPRRARNGGFALIEAMVAMLVMAFGMLSLVGMQSMLSRNADTAKQRTEAQRLAEEKLECGDANAETLWCALAGDALNVRRAVEADNRLHVAPAIRAERETSPRESAAAEWRPNQMRVIWRQ